MNSNSLNTDRRAFMRYLLASPAVCMAGSSHGQNILDPYAAEVIESPDMALNVFDFHETAKQVLMPGHYTYMALGTDDGGTLRANREGFGKFQLRVRRLVDGTGIDTTISLLDRQYPLPILIAPCGAQRAFHPEAELAVARAARSRGIEQILSTVSSSAIEDVNDAHGTPVWFQLYTSPDWGETLARVERAEESGCPALVLTVDLPASNREALARYRRDTNPECQACHAADAGIIPPLPMVGSGQVGTSFLDWAYVDRLRAATSMKLLIKGIVTAEDAAIAVQHGVDGIIVSNHGGRSEDSGRGTIECLPEVASAVDGRVPVIVDSGFRRGTDIFKGLALGADAIAIGRPYLWGLSAFGQAGVEAVIDILERELTIVMQQAGTSSIADINRNYIV
jgi:4-hydroxymandelate oxidase